MNKPTPTTKTHIKTTLSLAALVAAGIGAAYSITYADEESANITQERVRVETVELDFKQEQQVPAVEEANVTADNSIAGVETQFLFLLGLTVFGLVSIFGILRDFRRDRDMGSRR